MASKQTIENISRVAEGFKAVDRDGLLRPGLGKASLEKEFGPTLERLSRRLKFALEYTPNVGDQSVNLVAATFDQIRAQMEAQSQRADPDYVGQRTSFLSTVEQQEQQLLNPWPAFVAAAVEGRGFLEDEGIRKEYQSTVDQMRLEATKSLEEVRAEASKTIEEARTLAKQIEDRARKTAAHISVEAAQEQFRLAQRHHFWQVVVWGGVSVLTVVAFMVVAIKLESVQFPEAWKWHALYFTAIRVVVLGAIAAVAAFSFRILRAHMHLSERNLHRQRLANSMAAFVESAVTPEQRDLILGQLVDSIAAFGTSGLLSKDDDSIYSPKMVVDAVTRNLGHPGGG